MVNPLGRLAASVAVVLTAAALPALGASSAGAADTASSAPPARLAAAAPTRSSTVEIDLAQVRSQLRGAPRAGSRGAAVTFRLPTPSGSTERFAVQQTTVMEAKLAAAHPELRTYAGRSLDTPGTSAVLDVTPLGLHASVRGPQGQGAWYVDPASIQRGETTHVSYFASDVPRAEDTFVERETRNITRAVEARRTGEAKAPGALVRQRIYRLALTSDPAYAAYFGSENVLAEKVILINRVNQIYNDDLAISLRLVNATDDLNLDTTAKATGADGPCGAHPCFDPADPSDPESFSQLDFCDVPTLGRNRTVLGQIVGASNYDIGHIALGVNGGGVAYLGVVGADYKGGGCTGLPEPKGDFFAIDYVAHEMGHQFAGNHTFNGVERNCSGGNRNEGTSVEPGSGSSVMAYAGICGTDDLQAHTDPYFSQRSITEISTYTGAALPAAAEVQTVSLRGFDTDGESITLGFGGNTATLTRGTDYTAADVEDAVETLTGEDVTISGWGYDPYNSPTFDAAPLTPPDDTGFQVIFSPDPLPENAPADSTDLPSLTVSSASPGVSGFVGETAKGGLNQNTGTTVVTTRNHAPRVKAPANKTIPIRTPFTLKGRGTDSDGDRLTYLWEQNDEGVGRGTGLISNVKANGPLFRVFGTKANVTDEGTLESPSPGENLAGTSPSRTFPDLRQVLRGNTNAATGACPRVTGAEVPAAALDCFSEFLPTKGYVGATNQGKAKLHFRLTARDGFLNGGGAAHDDVTLRVDRSAGPFLVTSFGSKQSVKGGSTRVVRWKVNGTKKLAAKVRIRLSTDNGRTWRFVLAKTANDGRAVVRIPRFKTKHARIMVDAVDNYFFAVNDAQFRITR